MQCILEYIFLDVKYSYMGLLSLSKTLLKCILHKNNAMENFWKDFALPEGMENFHVSQMHC